MRFACALEYDGGAFRGWQRQRPGVRTIQAVVEQALSRVADAPITAVCAGRTDAGVHATGQVCHFDSPVERGEKAWVMGANTILPEDCALRWARPVANGFHARYSALSRRYRYVILEGWNRSALWWQRAAWYHGTLDVPAMQNAATHLLGEHDFTSFRSAACQARHAVRRIDGITIERRGRAVVIDVEGNAFLHNMVRIIAGVLLAVGAGEQPTDWTAHLLAAKDRTQAGVTAPARGLFLVGPRYGPEWGLPEPQLPPWPARTE